MGTIALAGEMFGIIIMQLLPTRTKLLQQFLVKHYSGDFSNDKLINIGNLSKKEEEARFRKCQTLDITADGKYVVGWSETDEYNFK